MLRAIATLGCLLTLIVWGSRQVLAGDVVAQFCQRQTDLRALIVQSSNVGGATLAALSRTEGANSLRSLHVQVS